jgi:prepilin-type N-terminal cleavage/methylation domain-containing protein
MRRHSRGFTLIEVMIVVMIMAILAGALIPKLSSSTTDAKKSSLKFNAQTMQTQIQVYASEHNGSFPALATFVNQMTLPTDVNGLTTGSALPYNYGPYIQGTQLPTNPFNLSNAIVGVATQGQIPTAVVTGGAGWQYDSSNGGFYPNDVEYYQAGF